MDLYLQLNVLTSIVAWVVAVVWIAVMFVGNWMLDSLMADPPPRTPKGKCAADTCPLPICRGYCIRGDGK